MFNTLLIYCLCLFIIIT